MNANFGLLDELPVKVKDKIEKRVQYADRALAAMTAWRDALEAPSGRGMPLPELGTDTLRQGHAPAAPRAGATGDVHRASPDAEPASTARRTADIPRPTP
jgi:hypothetical protein